AKLFAIQLSIICFVSSYSRWSLSLTIILVPEPWLVFKTNWSGNGLKFISEKLSQTPNNGIKYSEPIFSSTQFRTRYLSDNLVFSGVFKCNLAYCTFSVYFLGFFRLSFSLVLILYIIFNYES